MTRAAQLELVNPRVVFRAYAVAVGAYGLFAFLWGPVWVNGALDGGLFGINALVRIGGAGAMLLACAAAGLAVSRDYDDGRRALWWFVGGHWLLVLVIMMQGHVIWGEQLPGWYAAGLNSALLIASLLFAGMAVVEDRGVRTGHALVQLLPHVGMDRTLRSQYEEEIRKAAAREERQRLARDLHDAIKQQVFAIQTSAAAAEARLGADVVGAGVALAQVRDSARRAMVELETLTEGLRAAPIELSGLSSALRRECESLELRTGARVICAIDRLPPSTLLPPGSAATVFRIAQEALSNVARHARARRVEVTLRTAEHFVELIVRDDGQGFDPAGAAGGQGIDNMRARAAEHGGTLEITGRPREGTTVMASIPIDLVDPKYFRARAIGYTLAAGAVGLLFLLHWVPLTFEGSFLPLALFGFNAIRYALAWRRARRLVAERA